MEATNARVLLVEDDDAVRSAIEQGLMLHGFDVCAAASAEDAIVALARAGVDAIVLDVGLPNMNGIELCERLRSRQDQTPILILSAREGVGDRISGLEAGADDYVVKPFDLTELTLRLRALLRRTKTEHLPASPTVIVGPLQIDPEQRVASATSEVGTTTLSLTRREFELLTMFMNHPRVVLTRHQLLAEVWGYDFETETNVVDVFVGYLRKKIGAAGLPPLIKTVRGVGFMLDPPS